ncbi:MAG: hypothetical protein LUI02_00375 [Clostridiales bacterium]|nr:hypothetical protein [Clostridiales bacterium]
MSWLNKLERKFGRYAIPHLYIYLVVANVIGYFIEYSRSNLMDYLMFSPFYIMHGQVWRLISWVFIPSTSLDFFGLLFLLCVLMWGRSLESFLGTFKLDCFLFQGIIISDIGGFVIYFISKAAVGFGIPTYLTTYYILMTILLALAICMPDAEVRIYFVLPIRMKWMLVFELLYMAYTVFHSFRVYIQQLGQMFGIMYGFMYTAQIVLAIGSMFLFFWLSQTHLGRKGRKRRREFRKQFQAKPRPGSGLYQHKCAICGRTDLDSPNMQFRYCSKCNGNYEYCEEHLYTHKHIV